MLRDFWSFVCALWQEWKVLLTGSSIAALLGLSSLLDWWPPSKHVQWLNSNPSPGLFIVWLTLILAAFFAWRKEKERGDAARDAAQVDITLTPTQLTHLARGHTKALADALVQPYIRKRLRVTGTIHDVISDNHVVSLECDKVNIYLVLTAHGFQPFIPLPRGTPITVAGRIKEITPWAIILTNCEIVPTPAEAPQPTQAPSNLPGPTTPI